MSGQVYDPNASNASGRGKTNYAYGTSIMLTCPKGRQGGSYVEEAGGMKMLDQRVKTNA